jgi:tyrosyl-tRNA synthetase
MKNVNQILLSAPLTPSSSSSTSTSPSSTTSIKVLNNIDWWSTMNVVTYLRDVGRYFRMGNMLAKDSVRSRLARPHNDDIHTNTASTSTSISAQALGASSSSASSLSGVGGGSISGDGMSFTEFSYQTLQGYDYLHLARHHGCSIQIGGSDQWGNIIGGVELIHRCEPNHRSFAITVPLLTTSSGEKFGKSAGNAIWLDAKRTSSYQLYHYFLQTDDRDIERLLRLFTSFDADHINDLMNRHRSSSHLRLPHHALASYVTQLCHGDDGLIAAQRTRAALFGGTAPSSTDTSTSTLTTETAPTSSADAIAVAAASGAVTTVVSSKSFVGVPLTVVLRTIKVSKSSCNVDSHPQPSCPSFPSSSCGSLNVD